MSSKDFSIGLISDTHGMLRPGVAKAFKDVDRIIHAGDIDTPDVLHELEMIAPVTAVRGNMDAMSRLRGLPKTEFIELSGFYFYIIHDLQKLDLDPAAAGVSVLVYGHSHDPSILKKNGVLYANPGSAGPKRFKLPVTVGLLRINNGHIYPEIIEIDP